MELFIKIGYQSLNFAELDLMVLRKLAIRYSALTLGAYIHFLVRCSFY